VEFLEWLPNATYREKECTNPSCSNKFLVSLTNERKKYCCRKCKEIDKERLRRGKRIYKKEIKELKLTLECAHCGRQFKSNIPHKRYCTVYCSAQFHKNKYRNRAKKYPKEVEKLKKAHEKIHFDVELDQEELSIFRNAQPRPRLQNRIYFIMDGDVVIYVGSAKKNLDARIGQHYHNRDRGMWEFTHILVSEEIKHNLVAQEHRYIYHFKNLGQAVYNKSKGKRYHKMELEVELPW